MRGAEDAHQGRRAGGGAAAAAEDVLVSSAGRSSVVLPRVPTSDLRPGVLVGRSHPATSELGDRGARAAAGGRRAPRGPPVRFAYSRSDSLASSVGSPSMIRETLCFYSARGKNTLGTLLKESTTTETLSIAPSVRTRVM